MLRINYLRAYLGVQVKKLRGASKIETLRAGGSQLGSACFCALGPDAVPGKEAYAGLDSPGPIGPSVSLEPQRGCSHWGVEPGPMPCKRRRKACVG